MAITSFERNASIAEMAVEMDRRGAVIERLEREIAAQVETSARLVEDMMGRYPKEPGSRMVLAIAAKTIRRGRHLTEAEQWENLRRAMNETDMDAAEGHTDV